MSVAPNKNPFFKAVRLCGMFSFLAVVVLICACHSRTAVMEPDETLQKDAIILVLPFQNLNRIFGDDTGYRCPVSGKVYEIGEVAEGAVEFLNDQLVSALTKHEGLVVIPPGQAEGEISALLSKKKTDVSELELLIKTGERFGAEAVLLNRVYRFVRRTGKPYAVESPASVGLDMLLVRTTDSRILWNGYVDETQQPLSENLFRIGSFIRRRGKWLTAEEIATEGIVDALETFPGVMP